MAEGAAIQGAILAGIDKAVLQDVLMMDVLPISLGLETADGGFEVILPRNVSIPAEVTKYFHTFKESQAGITVEVHVGVCAELMHSSDSGRKSLKLAFP